MIHHDIIGTIKENVAAGNITTLEGQKLQRITLQLYRHIYEKYEEIEKAGLNEMTEEQKDLIITKPLSQLQQLGIPDEQICAQAGLSKEDLQRLTQ